jgi:hypothetical protein
MKPLDALVFILARLEEHHCHIYLPSSSMTATAFQQFAAATPSGSMPFSVMVGGLMEECVDHDHVAWCLGATLVHACH